MKAAPAQQRRLLDMADLDVELARARHRLGRLPEDAALGEVDAELTIAEADVTKAEAAVAELDEAYEKADAELTGMTEHAARDREKLESGALNHKAMAEMQHELAGLDQRRELLESDVLEIMERQEALAMELQRAQATVTALLERRGAAVVVRDHALAATENEITEFGNRRAAIAIEVDDALLAVYDRLREQGQVAAGLVRQRRCGACRIELDPRTLNAIATAADDDVVRCEECTAIMVRTEQSGLPTGGVAQ
ncbi:MAG: C4-type zinc ribbon domain-containing protein [Gordonia sp. (in: high G+C Gram-positive bacteria)]|uniref:zinc ribbon domain-containing protein n=1 Tax=Gordonia sp. (in: high G+C Gram-positive bacteria) TaxID=84139 RepID=UPI003BB7B0B6